MKRIEFFSYLFPVCKRPLMTTVASCLVTLMGILHASPLWAADDSNEARSDKQLTFYIGTSAGGGYDSYARTFAAVLSKHLPGTPTFTFKNMPAGDGMALANLIYNGVPHDGSALAISPAEIYLPEVLTPGRFNYDVRRLGWIGTISTTTDVLAVFKSTGAATIDNAKQRSLTLGAVGPLGTGSIYPQLSNAFLDTKFKIIHGYPGGNEINLAMETGELQGRVNQWNSWVAQRSQWINEGKLSYLLQFGPKVLDNVPELSDLVAQPQQKAMVQLIDLMQLVGRSVYTTPGLSTERLAALRKAFEDTMIDPEFVERMKQARLELRPRHGSELQADMERVLSGANDAGRDLKTILDIQ